MNRRCIGSLVAAIACIAVQRAGFAEHATVSPERAASAVYLQADGSFENPSAADPRGAGCTTIAYQNPTGGAVAAGEFLVGESFGQTITLAPGNHRICQVRGRFINPETVDDPADSPYQINMTIYNVCPHTGTGCNNAANLVPLYGPAPMDAPLLRTAGGVTLENIREGVWTLPPEASVIVLDAAVNCTNCIHGITIEFAPVDPGVRAVIDDSQPTVGLTPQGFTLCGADGPPFVGCSFTFGSGRTEVSMDVFSDPVDVEGACCNNANGQCAQVTTTADCTAPELSLTVDGDCDTPDPEDVECDILTGACCNTVAGTCTVELQFDCVGAGLRFALGLGCDDVICPLECQEGGNGQTYDFRVGRSFSDVSQVMQNFEGVEGNGIRSADNFTASVNGTLTSVRWWGIYNDPVSLLPCDVPDSPDNFTINIYNNALDLPFNLLATFNGPVTRTATGFGVQSSAVIGPEQVYQYDVSGLNVALSQDQCYWLEIFNNTTGNCVWRWMLGPAGDSLFVQDLTDFPYSAEDGDQFIGDLAWCVDIQVNNDGCNSDIELPGACCLEFEPFCEFIGPSDCATAGGTFRGTGIDCSQAADLCRGACCVGGECQLLIQNDCNMASGVFFGVGSTCDVNPCEGACCLSDGSCLDSTQDPSLNRLVCETSMTFFGFGGSWTPEGTCASTPCASFDQCDIDGLVVLGCNTSTNFNNNAQFSDEADGIGPDFPDHPDPSCFGGNGQGDGEGNFWVTFIGTGDSIEVSTCGSEVVDTVLAVYEYETGVGCPTLLVLADEIACSEDDDACGDGSLLSRICLDTTVNGRTYYVQVSSFGVGDVGNILVNVNCPCPAQCSCPGDVNADNTLDGRDVAAFVDCLTAGGSCLCADTDNSGTATFDDIPSFVTQLLDFTGPCAP